MGHANYSNLSRFFVRRLYAKGKLSIASCVEAMQKAGEEVQASEGGYKDEYMLAMALTEILAFLHGQLDGVVPPQREKIVEPSELAGEQKWAYDHFANNTQWDLPYDEQERFFSWLDSIEWKYGKGWRKQYPDGIPLLGNVTH